MAKRNKSKRKPLHQTVRNWNAVAAHFHTGGGTHGDKRLKRQRTRSAQKRAAIHEHC